MAAREAAGGAAPGDGTLIAAPLAGYPDLMTADHMAEILCESRRNIYRLVDRGALPFVRVGRRVYFPKRLVIEALRLGESLGES